MLVGADANKAAVAAKGGIEAVVADDNNFCVCAHFATVVQPNVCQLWLWLWKCFNEACKMLYLNWRGEQALFRTPAERTTYHDLLRTRMSSPDTLQRLQTSWGLVSPLRSRFVLWIAKESVWVLLDALMAKAERVAAHSRPHAPLLCVAFVLAAKLVRHVRTGRCT